eukprot:gene10573-3092_t
MPKLDFPEDLYSFEAIFDNEESKKVFKDYMEKSFVLEMYEFLEQVDDYTLLRSTINRMHKAKKIVETYILPNSPAEINIQQKTRVKVLEAYEAARIGKTPFLPNLFNAAQSIVHHDLTFDVFPRFVETDMFNDLMKHEFETLGEKKFKETYLLTQEQVKENFQTFDAYKQFKEGLDTELKNSKTNLKLDTTKLPLRFKHEQNEIQPLTKDFFSVEYIDELIIELSRPITGCSLYRSKSLFQKNTSKREILGADAVKWIQNYRFTNEELPVKNLLNYFILKKFLIPKDSKKSKFDPKGIYSFGFKKKIIIIGGGFSGMFAAKGLRDDFDVTVIDGKANLEYIMAFYKVIANPALINKYEIPFSKPLQKCEYIQGEVAAISPSGVYLKDKRVFLFDYLIVATGSNYVVPFEVKVEPTPFNFKTDELQNNVEKKKQASIIIPYSSESILKAYHDLRTSKNIVVVGGGAVALECAGELCVTYPNATINIITSGNGFLERRSKPIQKAATKIMRNYKNSKCFFNRYVTKIEENKVYFKYKTLKEDVEETYIETEAVIIAVGFRPNTGLFRTFMSDSLSSNGFVSVNEYFQCRLNQNIFTNRQLIAETRSFIEKIRQKMIEQLIVNEEEEIQNEEEDSEESGNDQDILNAFIKKDSEEDLNNVEEKLQKPAPKKRLNTVISFTKDESDTYSNIFAIGDVIDTTEEKLAYYGQIHGKKVSNIIQGLDSCNDIEEFKKKVKPYISKPDFVSNVVIGNSGIVFQGEKVLQKGKFVPIGKAAFEKYLMGQVIPS